MRRLGQVFVLVAMAISAVGAGAFSVIALYYHRFSTEVRIAHASVPATVDAVLSPTAGTLDQSQVTLVRGSGTAVPGGVVLLRTVPKGETTAFLSIPRSAVITGEPVGRLDTPGLVRGLSTTMGIRISHVAMVDLSNVSREGAPERQRGDQAEQRMLRAFVGRALAPTSVTQLPATGSAIAETATDLTEADVLGLVWTRLDDRRVLQCAFAEHQTIDSAQGHTIAATFLGQPGGDRPSVCRAHAVAPASVAPPKAVIVMLQRYGTWMFVMIAAAATLLSLGTAALLVRIRFGAATTGPVSPVDAVVPGPTRPVRLSLSQALAGAGSSIRHAPAGAAASVDVSMATLGRVGATIAALRRVGLQRATAIRRRASRWHVHGRHRAAELIGGGPWADPAYRSRVRRFAYMHQDAVWIGLVAAVATGILIRLLSS
jgi:hypothetical protein